MSSSDTDYFAPRAVQPPYQPPQAGRWNRPLGRRAFLGGALSVAAVGWIAWRPPLGLWPALPALIADYRTGPGEQRAIAPMAYTAVQMNTRTCINVLTAAMLGVRGEGETRDAGLELLSGEAEIRIHPGAPDWLPVYAGAGRVQARDATFNIRYTGPQVVVTCLQGAVQVLAGGQRTLSEGQQIAYDRNGMQPPVAADPAQVSAWRTGFLSFVDQPLSDVVAEINRYRDGRILINGDALGRRRVRMRLAIHDVDLAVAMFRGMPDLQVTELPSGLVLLS